MGKLRKRKSSLRRRFLGNKKGTAAIEFAVIIPVFLALMASTFEVGWFYFANAVLNASVTESSRFVRTGQAQLSSVDKNGFFDIVCDVVDTFGDCASNLTVDVATFANFSALASDTSAATCADAPPDDINAIPYNPGAENEIVRVRVCLIYETLNPVIGLSFAEPGTSSRRIVSSLIFRNEPFERNNTDANGTT